MVPCSHTLHPRGADFRPLLSFPRDPAAPDTLSPLSRHTRPHPHVHTHACAHTLRRRTLEVHTRPVSTPESHAQDPTPWWPPPEGPWATQAPGQLPLGGAGVSSCLGLARAWGHSPGLGCGAGQQPCGPSRGAHTWADLLGADASLSEGSPCRAGDTSLTFLECWGSSRRGKAGRPGPGLSL